MKTLETKRLILRAWQPDDLDDLYEYASNPSVGPMAGWKPHADKAVTLKILEYMMEKDAVWAMVFKATGKVIGSLSITSDRKRGDINARTISYGVSPDYWGQGLATEAVKCVMKFAFSVLNADLLSAYHYPSNNRSRRVLEKCGFVLEGVQRQASRMFNGLVMDDVCYSITKSEYYSFDQFQGCN